jgi:hypothetical protein
VGARHGLRKVAEDAKGKGKLERVMDAAYIGLVILLLAATLGLIRVCEKV